MTVQTRNRNRRPRTRAEGHKTASQVDGWDVEEEIRAKTAAKIVDEREKKCNYQKNTSLHRRREYRPPAAFGNAAKKYYQYVGEKCFKTEYKITYELFPLLILLAQKTYQYLTWSPADGLFPQIRCETMYCSLTSAFTSLLQCCTRHNVIQLNLVMLELR